MSGLDKLFGIQPDGGKFDHRHDPWDVTGHMEADPELRKQMERLGYVVRWAIDGRWRLTDRGKKELDRRKEEVRLARKRGAVGPLLPEHEPKEYDND